MSKLCLVRWRSARGSIERQCTQERWNSKGAAIFGTAVISGMYLRATYMRYRGFGLKVCIGRVLHTPLWRVQHARGLDKHRLILRRVSNWNLQEHTPDRLVHCCIISVRAFVALVADLALCYGESNNLT
jgi:hypothetical protein